MEITLGARLAKYRKKKGLSQEELAYKLDVSRQAVSKRERDEASPDTNNLIALSKIYNVSLDDLLYKDPDEVSFDNAENKDKDAEEKRTDSNKKKESVKIDHNGIHIVDKDDEVHVTWHGIDIKSSDKDDDNYNSYYEEKRKERSGLKFKYPKMLILKSIINGSGYLLITVIYLILGFTLPNGEGWKIYWTLYFIPEILNSTINCFLHKRVSSFNITFLSCFIYLFVGMYMNLWHPTRLIFLAIPLFYVIVENIEKIIKINKKKKEYNDKVVEIIED